MRTSTTGSVLSFLAGLLLLGCAGPPSEAVTAREQLADPSGAVAFDAIPDRSTVILSWQLTAPGLERELWIPLPIEDGVATVAAPGEALDVGLDVTLRDVPLVADGGTTLELAALSLTFAPDASCTAHWDAAGEAASGSCPLQLAIAWTLRFGGAELALPAPTLAPGPVMVQIDHVGDELIVELGGAVAAVDWSIAGFAARGTLIFGFEGSAPAGP